MDNGWSHTDQNCCITGGWAPLTVFKGDGYLVREEGQVNFSSACGKGRAFSLSTRKFNVTLFLLSLCSDLRFVDTTVNQTTRPQLPMLSSSRDSGSERPGQGAVAWQSPQTAERRTQEGRRFGSVRPVVSLSLLLFVLRLVTSSLQGTQDARRGQGQARALRLALLLPSMLSVVVRTVHALGSVRIR